MSNDRRFSIRFSGVGLSNDGVLHDGKMKVDYAYAIASSKTVYDLGLYDELTKMVPYAGIISLKNYNPILLNFKYDTDTGINAYEGITSFNNKTIGIYSFYRREYQVYQIGLEDDKPVYEEYVGEWYPVAINVEENVFRDFNIESDKTYQYIMYPSRKSNEGIHTDENGLQMFANYDGIVYTKEDGFAPGTHETAHRTGAPVTTHWEDWNIVELIPLENERNIPAVNKTYKVNLDQLWFFKYNLEVGSQSQTVAKNEVQTLGRFPKIGYGQANYVSGEVTALLGSEIVPGHSYTERPWRARRESLSTNEKVLMLSQWRKFVASKNPKLLRDSKGQAWIVQVMGGSNTPRVTYVKQPDTISFQWKQIDTAERSIIISDNTVIYSSCAADEGARSLERVPIFDRNGKKIEEALLRKKLFD